HGRGQKFCKMPTSCEGRPCGGFQVGIRNSHRHYRTPTTSPNISCCAASPELIRHGFTHHLRDCGAVSIYIVLHGPEPIHVFLCTSSSLYSTHISFYNRTHCCDNSGFT